MARYWLSLQDPEEWKEVTLEQFVKAEGAAGFRRKGSGPTATGGFSGSGVMGRITNDEVDLTEEAMSTDDSSE